MRTTPPPRPAQQAIARAGRHGALLGPLVGVMLGGCAGVPPGQAPGAGSAPASAPAAAAAPSLLAPGALTALLNNPPATAAAPAVTSAGTGPAAVPSAPAGPAGAGASPGAAAPPAAAASGATAAAAPSGAAAAGARPPATLTPPGPPSFGNVIAGARRVDGGPLTLWQKDDKVWIELLPEQFNQPFLLSPKIKNGIGEAWVLGGLMVSAINGAGGPQVVEFVRVHNTVRLQARNTEVVAKAGTPEALAVAASYSNSLLASTGVASAPHPERKSVLVEANAFFLNDILGVGQMLQRGLRAGYGMERGNTTITGVRATPQAVVIETQNHFVGSPPAPLPPALAALLGAPPGGGPRFLPDARSMLIGLHFSLAPLPATPMPVRAADPRVGLFSTTLLDFSDDLQRTPRQRVVNRWRLEKKDPSADLSDPVQPITFWIDRNVPLAYRETVRGAILEWNKAFEKIGFRGAIAVQQQPDDASFDTLDFGVASVRWMMNADPSFGAIGPSHIDPRTGEILDADIAFEGMAARSIRGLRAQVLAPGRSASLASGSERSGALPGWLQPLAVPGEPAAASDDPLAAFGVNRHALCLHATHAAEQMGYAMDVLEARGELDPDSPVAQQFVLDYVKDSIMHEVGHALGLRHNFRASRIYSEAQLSDPEFTRAHGTTGSVMEYNPVNLARPGERGGMPFQTTLGPYDYWAIEYAYKPMLPGSTAAQVKAELQRIAARNTEPQLAFGTDEDAFFGLDPETLQLDLGNDPLAFAAKRLEIARDLFRRQETRTLPSDRDYAVLRRSISYALTDAVRALGVLARQIGGVRTLRDYPGSGRDPLLPVDAALQRQALDLMLKATLAPGGLAVSPALQRRMAPDYHERFESLGMPTEFSVSERLLDLQRAVLSYLMSDGVARRILDTAGKLDKPDQAFQLSEVYERLLREVWSELGSGKAIAPDRRELQREHANRLALAVVRPSVSPRVEARSLLRDQARQLLARLDAATRRSGLDGSTRAHLADSAETLRQALAAPLQRQAF